MSLVLALLNRSLICINIIIKYSYSYPYPYPYPLCLSYGISMGYRLVLPPHTWSCGADLRFRYIGFLISTLPTLGEEKQTLGFQARGLKSILSTMKETHKTPIIAIKE